mmetsp:Transcript_30567/g.46870  ORF Transcript_30567/g.46870 Transcript_30567/m.46870 type:complete len:298 (+) Transcript_30567:388-1281(+)
MIGDRSPFGYTFSRVFILDKIKRQLGLEYIEKMFYVAAPLKKDTSKFFSGLNMPISSIFGLSETSGPLTYQEFPNIKFSREGPALPGTQIKVFNPDQDGIGEICVKGRNVFMGYLKSEQENYDAFDAQGFFHSGDIGYIEPQGQRLVVTGRLKDIIITAGGENISPDPIEYLLKSACPIISYCVVIGDDKPYLTMLVTLKVKMDERGKATNDLDPNVQSVLFRNYAVSVNTIEQAKTNDAVIDFITSKIKEINKTAQSRVHTVKKFVILDREFTVDNGELTPTLKPKRKVIEKLYRK